MSFSRSVIDDFYPDGVTESAMNGFGEKELPSMDVTDELSYKHLNVPQPEVYKYLYSLFRSRCFTFENSDFDNYNSFITGFNVQADE